MPGHSAAAFSFIRTVTVGSGIAPESARPTTEGGARGLVPPDRPGCHYRRWGIPPRPENVYSADSNNAPRLLLRHPGDCLPTPEVRRVAPGTPIDKI